MFQFCFSEDKDADKWAATDDFFFHLSKYIVKSDLYLSVVGLSFQWKELLLRTKLRGHETKNSLCTEYAMGKGSCLFLTMWLNSELEE